MKKILFLTLSLLAIVGSARAQHWSYEEGQHPMETFIYADLVLDGETVNSGDVLSQYEVAAFIGDEVRAIGEIYTPQNTPVSIYLLRFRIEGEQADLNKSITFKAFHNNAEYDLEMREEPLPTFTGETLDPGAPSNPRHLYLAEPTQLTMENIVLNVGDEVDLLTQNKCFKLKMNSDAGAQPYDFFGGQLGEMEAITLRKGWNWIPNPYIFSRTFENAFADMVFTEGDRIVGQDAFAEYNGNAWEGSLQGLSWSEGYLFFNAGEAGRELIYASEFDMSGADDFVEEQPAPSRFKSGAQLPFSYDVRRFRDNMTIVAELDGTADSNRYQVFAFVGDECRGRGISQNGKHFITVHAEAGEQVSFKLYDTLTDQLLGVDQTVQMQQTAGTLKAPMQLTSLAVTTGISNVENASQDGEHFDLGGRNVNASQKGLHIMRQADGTVRKMIRK